LSAFFCHEKLGKSIGTIGTDLQNRLIWQLFNQCRYLKIYRHCIGTIGTEGIGTIGTWSADTSADKNSRNLL